MTNNFVFLAGWLHLDGEEVRNDLAEYMLTWVDVDRPHVGGRLRVLLTGPSLEKIRAVRAALPEKRRVQVSLTGKLVGRGERYVVQVDEIHVAVESARVDTAPLRPLS